MIWGTKQGWQLILGFIVVSALFSLLGIRTSDFLDKIFGLAFLYQTYRWILNLGTADEYNENGERVLYSNFEKMITAIFMPIIVLYCIGMFVPDSLFNFAFFIFLLWILWGIFFYFK
ncbi:hypothetical protein J5TS1_32510 [Bacillus licheniformis]|uniref:hypothetical protein n=1 Tax=Bacillus TaxID=1386 RepID=UPI00038E4FB6|nr:MULTISPECIES: hypothetical protein [Bacillus]EQM25335.1 hypothetical protein N399_24085 [Bacillus licheniformis CG-B52]MDE1362798.1 hypothetical protein [Bacillus paralicheniformis]MED4305374.1 hypothetical protein [Bacillus licheniformis]QDF79181.1 hypothetical protein BLCSL_10205 [Bacillus licheniformis]GIN35748.1 hypothetical protein J5TS1_32510 [Bacillus licheniformis]